MATHLAPVAKSLIDTEYNYTNTDFRRQGYKNFCNNVTAPATVINIGYNAKNFYKTRAKKPNTFITVAQMNNANYYRKGVDLIFAIAEKFDTCTFTIVGNSKDMKYRSIPANVKLLPFIKYEELINLYSESEFYLQLSIMEGFPSAPCEAMLCECIPITSNVGALTEIVGDTGYVLVRKDVNELEKIIHLAINGNEKSGVKARERIIQLYPADIRMKLVELVQQLSKK
jgi:glycosyltransferase involved in cell wall biosynthesis